MATEEIRKRREALIGLLKDSAEEVRLAAAKAIERLEGIESLGEVLQLLKKGNRGTKIKAIYALGRIGGEKVIPPLLYCIGRPEEDIKCAAIEVLGLLAYPRVLAPLAEKLRDASDAVKAKALAALGNFPGRDQVHLIIPFLSANDGYLEAEALKTLARIGDASLSDRIIPLLGSPYAATREAAASALGDLPVK